jgi:hypothetical protein
MGFVISACFVGACILFAAFGIVSTRTSDRLQRKAHAVEAGVRELAGRGGDPSPIFAVVDQVKPSLEAGDTKKAEALLDQALTMLAQDVKTAPAGNESALPVFAGKEKESDLYVDPEAVTIVGYSGSAMEPFISPDGRFLFFNNENDPAINTNLHFARRTGTRTFQYLGELPGVNSPSLDAVPSIDSAGHFYFTTLRDYDRTGDSIYTGHFNGRK